MEMLKKFVWWFICFGASFFVANVLGWTDQGRAFLYIDIASTVVALAIAILVFLIAGIASKMKLLTAGVSILFIIIQAVSIVIALFATWGATKLFDVDFFVAYQIMSFGACLATTSKKEKE